MCIASVISMEGIPWVLYMIQQRNHFTKYFMTISYVIMTQLDHEKTKSTLYVAT